MAEVKIDEHYTDIVLSIAYQKDVLSLMWTLVGYD